MAADERGREDSSATGSSAAARSGAARSPARDADGFPLTVPGLLRHASRQCRGRGLIFVDEDERHCTWEQVEAEASAIAAGLQERGGEPGDRVAVVCQGLRPLVTGFFGAALAGLHPTILPTPISRRRVKDYARHTGTIVGTARPRFLLVDEPLEEVGEPLLHEARVVPRPEVVVAEELAAAAPGRLRAPEPDPDDIAVIQFTSGSTSAPRGVVLPQRCVAANVRAIVEHLEVQPEDVGGGWLPLYHDMGLIGNLLGAAGRAISLVLTTPFNFLRRPRRWLDIMERHGVSITAGPNVSYRHLLERGEPAGQDLSSWRVAIIGAEPIDPGLLDTFTAAFAPLGFPRTGFMPAYGLAEVGLMVTGVPAGSGYSTVNLDREVLEQHGRAEPALADERAVRIVGCGVPVRDTEVRVVDRDRQDVPERHVGEILVTSASTMRGYFDNRAATREVLVEGWLRTGDLGFVDDGELFVTGRKKELIIVHGRNYYPQDIERVVQSLEEVRPGTALAFGVRDGAQEGVVVVASPRDPRRTEALASGIRQTVSESLNLPVMDVVLVESGRIPRTTSGKLCRGRCRDLYESGGLA